MGPIEPTTEPAVAVPAICTWWYSSQSETDPSSTGVGIDGVVSVSIDLYPLVINVPNVEPPPDENSVTVTVHGDEVLQLHFYPSTEDLLVHNGVCVYYLRSARCTRDLLGP